MSNRVIATLNVNCPSLTERAPHQRIDIMHSTTQNLITWAKNCGDVDAIGTFIYLQRQGVFMNPINIPEEELKKLYINEGLSLRDIGCIVGCSHWTVRTYLHKYGIPIRDFRKGKVIKCLKDTNDAFESIDGISPDWLVGFVDGEGSFFFRFEKSNHRLYPAFSLAQNDKNLLEWIGKCFPDIKFNISQSPSGTWHLSTRYLKNCAKLITFFDKHPPIRKKDQYAIWKFLFNELLVKTFNNDEKVKTFAIYKQIKTFSDFKNEYMFLRQKGGITNVEIC